MTMSDSTDPREELASAHLDDELDADERALIEGDDEMLGLVEEYRAISHRVGSPPAARAGAVDDAVAAALTALDGEAPVGEDPGEDPAADVIDLGERRRWRSRTFAGIGVAAAALIGVVAISSTFDSDDDSDLATRAVLADEDAGGDSLAGDAEMDMSEAMQEGSIDEDLTAGVPTTFASGPAEDGEAAEDGAETEPEAAAMDASPDLRRFLEEDPVRLFVETARIEQDLRALLRASDGNARSLVDSYGQEAVESADSREQSTIESCGEFGSVVIVDRIGDDVVVVTATDDEALLDNAGTDDDYAFLLVHPSSCAIIATLMP